MAYIAPNTHAQLESFYAVPQIGAVLVPINYRLTADDFAYIINHSGARVVCAHSDYLDAVDGIRAQLPNVEQFVALEGSQARLARLRGHAGGRAARLRAAGDRRERPASINYTSGTTSRPKGVMITHRNAYMNVVGTLVASSDDAERSLPVDAADVPRQWLDVRVDRDGGWRHARRACRKVEPRAIFELMAARADHHVLRRADGADRLANAPEELRRNARRGVRLFTAGAPPAAATIERIEGEFGWELTHVYGLTETSPFITICEPLPEHSQLAPRERAAIKARQGVELITSGELRIVDDDGNEVPHDGQTLGEIVVRGNVVMAGYYNDPEATAEAMRDGWFHSGDAAVVHPDGYAEIRDRFKDVIISGGENISSVEVEGVLLRHPAVQEVGVVGMRRERGARRRTRSSCCAGRDRDRGGADDSSRAIIWRTSRRRRGSRS